MNNILLKKRLFLPFLALAIFSSLFIIWRLLSLPSQDQMIIVIHNYFDLYGLPVIFISAVIEGLLLAGWYYPGSVVIFLGVLFAGHNIFEVIITVLVVTLGLLVAYVINYSLGRYGWYKLLVKFGLQDSLERAQENIERRGVRAIFASYWQPNFASLAATAAGILKMPFGKFLIFSIIATCLWDTFCGTIVYFFGEQVLSFIGIWFILFFFTAWIIYEIVIWKRYAK